MKLANGVEMPEIGFGTYPLFVPELLRIVREAWDVGYRMFDTADNYYNESDLGEALDSLYKTSEARRKDIFLVTKVSDELYRQGMPGRGMNRGMYFWKTSPLMRGEGAVHRIVHEKVENSLRALKTDYIDLLLMHRPYPDFFVEIWTELEKLYEEGKVRAIGVCGCYDRHFELLRREGRILPMVNQIQVSPVNAKGEYDFCRANGIALMGYSPLMSLRFTSLVAYQNALANLAAKYGRSQAQILLRWLIQRGVAPIPKTTHKERLIENISVFDFELEESDVALLTHQNINFQTLPESKACPGF